MRSCWIRGGPVIQWRVAFYETAEERHRAERPREGRAATGVTWSQPGAASRCLRRDGPPPIPPPRPRAPGRRRLALPASRAVGEDTSVVLSHRTVVICYSSRRKRTQAETASRNRKPEPGGARRRGSRSSDLCKCHQDVDLLSSSSTSHPPAHTFV